MRKKQFNFRLPEWVLERIKEQADREGVTITEWMENACLSELQLSQDSSYRIESSRDKERLKNVEYRLQNLENRLDNATNRLDENINGIWDSLHYITGEVEGIKNIVNSNNDNDDELPIELAGFF